MLQNIDGLMEHPVSVMMDTIKMELRQFVACALLS